MVMQEEFPRSFNKFHIFSVIYINHYQANTIVYFLGCLREKESRRTKSKIAFLIRIVGQNISSFLLNKEIRKE